MLRFKLLYVYILKCSDNTYYTGVTNDPERRLSEHQSGRNKKAYTFNKRPVQMLYCEGFTDFRYAIDWEKRIKNWSQKKKEALINSNWEKLMKESECKNHSHYKISANNITSRLRSK